MQGSCPGSPLGAKRLASGKCPGFRTAPGRPPHWPGSVSPARPASPTRNRTAAPRVIQTLTPPPATRQPHLGHAPRSHRPPAAPPPPPPPEPGPSPPLPLPPLPAPPAPGSASRPRPLGARASGQARTRVVVAAAESLVEGWSLVRTLVPGRSCGRTSGRAGG